MCMLIRIHPAGARYRWYNTTVTEMYLFLGIIIAMGVHKLPFFYDYWSLDCLLGLPGSSNDRLPARDLEDDLSSTEGTIHRRGHGRFQGQKQYEAIHAHEVYKVWLQGVVSLFPQWHDERLRDLPRVHCTGKGNQLEYCCCTWFS